MSGAKTNRIDLRVSQEQKDLLETAASIKGISLSAYLLANCLEIAQADIAKHQKLVLSDRDRDLFISLIANPPKPNQDLVEAMQEFQQEYEV
ncbi:MAG: DUF1778 domain-containing protein [Xenococcaceae cyanobacterium MO_188.B32]|nr:DUF1778 domain-containing protein [Xenococcaceae cyanobacterium MO_188.B32]